MELNTYVELVVPHPGTDLEKNGMRGLRYYQVVRGTRDDIRGVSIVWLPLADAVDILNVLEDVEPPFEVPFGAYARELESFMFAFREAMDYWCYPKRHPAVPSRDDPFGDDYTEEELLEFKVYPTKGFAFLFPDRIIWEQEVNGVIAPLARSLLASYPLLQRAITCDEVFVDMDYGSEESQICFSQDSMLGNAVHGRLLLEMEHYGLYEPTACVETLLLRNVHPGHLKS